MLVVIAAVYAVFTLPYHVTWLFSVFGYPNSVAKKLCVLLVIATSAAHPIIYGTLNQEFKKGFQAFFRFTRKRNRSNDPKDTSRRHVRNNCGFNVRLQKENENGGLSHGTLNKQQRVPTGTSGLDFEVCHSENENELNADEIVTCL